MSDSYRSPSSRGNSISTSIYSAFSKRSSLADSDIDMGHVLAMIVEDAIDQLYILGAGLVPNTSIQMEELATRAKQYVAGEPAFDRETGEPFQDVFYRKKIMKTHYDSTKAVDLLVRLRDGLCHDGSFYCLTKLLKEIKSTTADDQTLLSDLKKNQNKMIALRQTFFTDASVKQESIRSLNKVVLTLQDVAEDGYSDQLLRTRYLRDWEGARREQNNIFYFEKDKTLKTRIQNYEQGMRTQNALNKEIRSFIIENQKDMEDEIKAWMKRYDKESESRNLEITRFKAKREDLATAYVALQELSERLQKEIDDYLQYKEKLRLEKERIAFLTIYAIKIQAWWRGVMVRHKLGRFKPPEERKKERKERKKKGKGKKTK